MAKAKTWEESRGVSFMYDGVPLLAVLDEYVMLRKEREEDKNIIKGIFYLLLKLEADGCWIQNVLVSQIIFLSPLYTLVVFCIWWMCLTININYRVCTLWVQFIRIIWMMLPLPEERFVELIFNCIFNPLDWKLLVVRWMRYKLPPANNGIWWNS